MELARRSILHAKRIGAASRVFKAIHHALTSESPVAARLESRNGARVVVLMRAQEQLAKALRREGAVVVTDANAELHAPIYARVVGYERPVRRFEADDGAPIERTMLRLRSATRSAWQPQGQLVVATSRKTALTLAIAWAREDANVRVLALITMPIVRVAIEAARSPADATCDIRWAKLGQEARELEEARCALAPIVRAWPGQILFAHYGATRGLDAMAGADALVTLGDPWINAGDAKHECAFLGVEDWESRYAALCRAELEQAHGRLRTVHRTRPGRALHVGAVRPSGRGWARDDVRVLDAPPRVRRAGGATAEEIEAAIARAGGVKALARERACSATMVRKYRERGGALDVPGACGRTLDA